MFRRIATRVSNVAGSAWAFGVAALIILSWGLTGPMFDFSNTWQLVINTGTTIVTFLMVFLIQSTQNRDGRAMQLKLDELIRATRARDSFIDIEDLSDDELEVIAAKFRKIHADSEDPTVKKFYTKLDDIMNKRRSLPGAEEVGSLLNPFSAHDQKKRK